MLLFAKAKELCNTNQVEVLLPAQIEYSELKAALLSHLPRCVGGLMLLLAFPLWVLLSVDVESSICYDASLQHTDCTTQQNLLAADY